MVGRKITIIASPLLKEWKLKKLIGRDGVIIVIFRPTICSFIQHY